MLVCVFFAQFCTRDRGCSAHPAFPAASDFKARKFMQTSGASRRENADSCPSTSLRGALATKQSIFSLCGAMDCFASLAMTVAYQRRWRRPVCSRRLCRLQPEPGLYRVTHDVFLDFPGDGHRKIDDIFDVASDLVMRSLALAESQD